MPNVTSSAEKPPAASNDQFSDNLKLNDMAISNKQQIKENERVNYVDMVSEMDNRYGKICSN